MTQLDEPTRPRTLWLPPDRRGGRIAIAVAGVLVVVAACSSVPDAVNPVSWYEGVEEWVVGDEEAEPGTTAPDSRLVAERDQPPPGADQPFPSLADVPDRPSTSTPAERRAVAEGLVADRQGRRYADEVIAGQGEPAQPLQAPATAGLPRSVPPVPALPESATPMPSRVAAAPPQTASPESVLPSVSTPPGRADEGAAQAAASPPPAPPRSVVAPPTPPTPSVPARELAESMPPPPPVDEALAQVAAKPMAAAPPRPVGVEETFRARLQDPVPPGADAGPLVPNRLNIRPPSQMATVVVSSTGVEMLDLRPTLGAGTRGVPTDVSALPMQGTVRVATILFENGSSRLRQRDRQILREVSAMHRDRGGQVRIVGHASSRTRNMDPVRHKLVNFQVSAARADAVARELARLGVSRDAIQVAAVGDEEPEYYEIMPSGEAGNRRADVFLEY